MVTVEFSFFSAMRYIEQTFLLKSLLYVDGHGYATGRTYDLGVH